MNTSLPWKANFEGAGIENGGCAQIWIMGGDGLNVVGRLKCGGSEDAKDNASLIIKAVNCHDDLLDALKDVMAQAARHSNPDSAAMYRANQAILKAEGR